MIDTTLYPFPEWLLITIIVWLIIGLYGFFVQIQTLKKAAFIMYNQNFWKTKDFQIIKNSLWFLPLIFSVGGALIILIVLLDYPINLISFKYYKIPDIQDNVQT